MMRGDKRKTAEKEIKAWPLQQRPGFLIRRLHQTHIALFQTACGKFDLTPLQYSLLSALAVRGAADQTTLAADIALDRTTTTGVLKRLASRHLIERPVDAKDKRARLCRLTASGEKLLQKVEKSAREAHYLTLKGLTATEQDKFVVMMQRVLSAHENDRCDQ